MTFVYTLLPLLAFIEAQENNLKGCMEINDSTDLYPNETHFLCFDHVANRQICLIQGDVRVPLSHCKSPSTPHTSPTHNPALKDTPPKQHSNTITDSRWDCPLPFRISEALDPRLKERIRTALGIWESSTEWVFVERSDEADYIVFEESEFCNSNIGRTQGLGAHAVGLNLQCSLRSVVHEIGHAIGFWHEHTRKDRDNYVEILYNNINNFFKPNFVIADHPVSYSITKYDFLSIMHYAINTFSCVEMRNCELDRRDSPSHLTIKIKSGAPACCKNVNDVNKCCVGKLENLSEMDIIAANERMGDQKCPKKSSNRVLRSFGRNYFLLQLLLVMTVL